jgi:hypothetical protein
LRHKLRSLVPVSLIALGLSLCCAGLGKILFAQAINGVPSQVMSGFIPGVGGAPILAGWVSCTQANCTGSATTLVTVGSATTLYVADISADCSGSTSLATANVTVTYTDASSTVQTISLTSAAVCTTLGPASISSLTQPFTAKNATAIQYNVTTANTPSYQARVAILQEGVN